MLEETVFMVSRIPHIPTVAALFFFLTTEGHAAEPSVLPQADTCTDLMTVFCRSHVAAREMEMHVCVIRAKCTQRLSFCAQQRLGKYNGVLKSH